MTLQYPFLSQGFAVVGFGGAAIVAAPIMDYLLAIYAKPPQCLGSVDDVKVITENGKCFIPFRN